MPRSLIGLGANLGDRRSSLQQAIRSIEALRDVELLATSGFHETAPVGGPAGQGPYLNAAATVETSLQPAALHRALQRIESASGRTRGEHWGARTLDLDLLLYGEQIVSTPDLSVPHPRMSFRRFVLAPAVEVAADMPHPFTGTPLGQLLDHLDRTPCYVAILGVPGPRKTELAESVARAAGGTYLADPVADWHVAAGDDPSGHVFATPIQFVDRAADRLAGLKTLPAPVVSDYYFDECLAFARTGLDQEAFETFSRNWAERHGAVAAPRLLVVLDDWQTAAAVRSGEAPQAISPAERLRRELLLLSLRKGQGPVLYAGYKNCPSQFEEITAAIAAMR